MDNNQNIVVLKREGGLLLCVMDVSHPSSPLAESVKDLVAHALFELFDKNFDEFLEKNGTYDFQRDVTEAIIQREREYIKENKNLFDQYIKENQEQLKKDKKDPYFRNRDDFDTFYRLYLLSARFTVLVKKDNKAIVLNINPLNEKPEEINEEPEVVKEKVGEPVPVIVEEKQPEPEAEPEPEPQPEPAPAEEEVEEEVLEEPETEVDENGNVIYITKRTFLQKLGLVSQEQRDFYKEIKEEALSYGLKSRVSSSGDTFSSKRIGYLKIGITGRTLKLHYRLDPKDYAESPIPVEDDSEKKLYVDIPLAFRVKSNLAVKRAKKLLADAMSAAGIEKVSVVEETEENKKIVVQKSDEPEKKVEVKQPQPVVVEKPKEQPQPVEEVEEEDEVELDEKGFPVIKKRTFYEKLLRSRNETRHAYKEIKDYGVETYGLTSRVSAQADSLSYKRKNYVKLQIFGKTLKIHYRLDPKAYAESPIPVEDDSSKVVYEELPLAFKVKSDLAMRRAKKLIDDAMKAAGIEKLKK